jgi:hypothetical protein
MNMLLEAGKAAAALILVGVVGGVLLWALIWYLKKLFHLDK